MTSNRKNTKFVAPMEKHALERLHTGSLLTRLKNLRSLQERPEHSDWTKEEKSALANVITVKNSQKWKSAVQDVKSILADRDHIPRGSKERRRQAAHAKKHR